MSSDFRTRWRQNWLRCLEHFSNVCDQRRHWLDPHQTNPHWSFVEIMCEYFDDCGLSDGYDELVAEGVVSEAEHKIIADWHSRLDCYEHPTGDDYDNAAVLDDPTWLGLCEEAARLRQTLASVIHDPAERAFLR